ncbi:MAG: serine hydrolase, partial [Thermoanaerobaculia bacterium]|nr:serine hydrolase [Thermoanaerobaculia bacterium]
VMTIHPLVEWTGGGLVNNPQDLVRWAKALYEGEAIAGDYLDELVAVGFAPDPEQPEAGYGLGVSIAASDHGPRWGHGGFFPGYNSILAYFPAHRVAVAIQINSDKSEAGRHAMTLAGIVLDAVAAADPAG